MANLRVSASIGQKLGAGRVDRLPQRCVRQAGRQVADDQPEERPSRAVGRGGRGRYAHRDGPGVPMAGVDGPRVVVAAGVGLDAAADPLGAAGEAVEIDVADDGVDRARARATSSGVTISGQAPCWALVASMKRGSPA